MNTDEIQVFSMTEVNRNFSKVARVVDQYGSAIILKNNKPRYKITRIDDKNDISVLKVSR